jgi:hypothetical protein
MVVRQALLDFIRRVRDIATLLIMNAMRMRRKLRIPSSAPFGSYSAIAAWASQAIECATGVCDE